MVGGGGAATSGRDGGPEGRHDGDRRFEARMGLEQFVAELSTRLVNVAPAELDPTIDGILADLGSRLGVDRSFVFLRDPVRHHVDCTHEWCAPGTAPQIAVRKRSGRSTLPWWWRQMEALQTVHIDDVSALPAEAVRERAIFASQDIVAMLCVPMSTDARMTGFLGIEVCHEPKRLPADVAPLLRIVAQAVWAAIARARTEQRLASTTERLRTNNRELERVNRELVRANAAKDEFVSVASHELRTPLTSILGFVETLQSRWAALDDPGRRRLLAVVNRQAARLSVLVDALLATSRIMAGAAAPDPEPVDPCELVAGLRQDGHEFASEVHCTGTGTVFADRAQLERVIANLLDNAHKYGRPPVTVGVEAAGERVRVTVGDHGTGVPAAFQHRLFERFSQASTGDRRTARGTGLGLSIVRDLVELNGGTITYTRHPSAGACFVVDLPAAPA